jgi:hypothetical protein
LADLLDYFFVGLCTNPLPIFRSDMFAIVLVEKAQQERLSIAAVTVEEKDALARLGIVYVGEEMTNQLIAIGKELKCSPSFSESFRLVGVAEYGHTNI